MSLVPAKCPECGGNINIDPEKKAGICEYCKQPFVVQEAIQNFNTTYNITNNNEIKADVVNVYENREKDFVIEAGVLKEYKGSETIITIPKGVLSIGEGCFRDMRYIEEVIMPEGLREICKNAFSYCESLIEVVLPSTIEYVSDGAFYSCKNIKNVIAPKSVDVDCYMDAFPDLFSSQIKARNDSIDEKVKLLACGELPEIFGNDYTVMSFEDAYKNNAGIKGFRADENVGLIYDFIDDSERNPIKSLNINSKDLHSNILGCEYTYWFRGVYGHYYIYKDSGDYERIAYIKECFTNREDVEEYLKQKEQEYLSSCKRKRVCPFCGTSLTMFGQYCKNKYCKKKYRDY